jgi:hypothetical protein
MRDETLQAVTDLVETIEAAGYHVSGVDAEEYLAGGGFDPDEVMGTQVTLTVGIEGNTETDDDNPFRVS